MAVPNDNDITFKSKAIKLGLKQMAEDKQDMAYVVELHKSDLYCWYRLWKIKKLLNEVEVGMSKWSIPFNSAMAMQKHCMMLIDKLTLREGLEIDEVKIKKIQK